MKKISILLFIGSFFLIIGNTSTSAYTANGGLVYGDQASITYVLTVDGTEKEDGTFDATVGQNLIEGFSEGLVGMKVGQDKIIEVPPSKGYTTPSHELYGKTLFFDVHINSLICCDNGVGDPVDTDTEETSTSQLQGSSNTGSIIENVLASPITKMVGIIFGVIFVYGKFLAPKPQ